MWIHLLLFDFRKFTTDSLWAPARRWSIWDKKQVWALRRRVSWLLTWYYPLFYQSKENPPHPPNRYDFGQNFCLSSKYWSFETFFSTEPLGMIATSHKLSGNHKLRWGLAYCRSIKHWSSTFCRKGRKVYKPHFLDGPPLRPEPNCSWWCQLFYLAERSIKQP
jgi:hypothetical protein